jgi:hypothetical protein
MVAVSSRGTFGSALQVAGGGGATVANATDVIAEALVVAAKDAAKIIVNANIITSVFCFFVSVWTDISSILLVIIIFYKHPVHFKDISPALFNNHKYLFGFFRSNYQKFMYKRDPDLR